MKKQYIRPQMDIIAITHHRILAGSDRELTVDESSGGPNDKTDVGW